MSQGKFTKILTQGGRVGGILDKKSRTLKKVVTSKHYLRYPELALACDVSVLQEAKKAGAEWLQYTDTDTGIVYRTPLEVMLLTGDDIDFGFYKQKKLPVRCFIMVKPTGALTPQQMDFWGKAREGVANG